MPASDWNVERLKLMVAEGQEEDLQLDFKSGDAISAESKRKEEIGRDVSALANAGGGILIYGITESKKEPGKAGGFQGIDPAKFSTHWLDQVINSNIVPRIPGVGVYPISLATVDAGRVAYVVEVPQSTTAHQAKDLRYYRRHGTENRAMDDFAIRDVMFPAKHPRVEVTFDSRRTGVGPNDITNFQIMFRLTNVGTMRALAVKLDFGLPRLILSPNPPAGEMNPDLAPLSGHPPSAYDEIVNIQGQMHEPLFPTDYLVIESQLLHLDNVRRRVIDERRMCLRWSLFADDMPPVRGEKSLAELINY